ncbi:MAG: UDP-glucose 4-epimerase GalE [Spirochaetes bacterium GWF1_51_8]|nr:MAG: UDP-glucose 4-epimerase GalE [Spirochaetes bacterium GWF1_51_8]
MAILVAGGCGYIGSHVCKMLSKRGYDVIVADNLSHGYAENAKWGRLEQADIGDRAALDRVFAANKIDAVMHFCAYIEVGESAAEPSKYYRNNVANTLVLLDAMMNAGVDKFIFSSTAAVYGVPQRTPIEEDDPKNPINPYGRTKYMVEQILGDYGTAYGLKSIAFRYFNAAGADPDTEIGEAHIPETHLIPLVLDAALGLRDSIKIYGTDYKTPDGTCLRDYVHVNDLADAHIRGLEYLLKGGNSSCFNLGSGRGFSVREIIDTVAKVTGKPVKAEETPRRAGDPDILVAKSAKAFDVLGWKPVIGLDEIVATAWKWHKKYKKAG